MAKRAQKLSKLERIPPFEIDKKAVFIELNEEIQAMRSDQEAWLIRQNEYISQWDNYIDSPTLSSFPGGANYHIPLTMVMSRAIHARFHAAMFDIRPWFITKPVERMDKSTVLHVDRFMQWTLTDYINYYQGVEEVADDWLWDIGTIGWGLLKRLWDRMYINTLVQKDREELENTLIDVSRETSTTKDAEKNVKEVLELVKQFDGPVVESVEHSSFLMPGRFNRISDMNEPTHICHDVEFDAHQLNIRAEQGIFFKDAVNKLIKKRGKKKDKNLMLNMTESAAQDLKRTQDEMQGVKGVDAEAGPNMFRLQESYRRFDINNDSKDEEVILWSSEDTNELIGWNFLHRVYPSGRRPFHKGDFIRRPRRAYSIGLVELLFPTNSEADALHNQRIDFGTLQTAAYFFYKPQSGMKEERIRIEPGVGIPLDNPQRDVAFPKPPQTMAFQFTEEQAMISFAEKLSSIGDIQQGVVPNPVGGTRTVGGTAQLLEQANLQLNVLIKRWQKTWGEFLHGLQEDCSFKAPKGLKFRVLGASGEALIDEQGNPLENELDRLQLKAKVDYKFIANANNINRSKEEVDAITLKQLLVQQLEVQFGIVTPINIYNLNKNILEKRGQGDFADDYLTKPENVQRAFSLIEEIASIIQGQAVEVVVNDNHTGKVEALQIYFNSEDFAEMASKVDEGGNVVLVNKNWQQALAVTVQKHMQQQQILDQLQTRIGNVEGARGFQNPQLKQNPDMGGQNEKGEVGPSSNGSQETPPVEGA